MRRRRAEQFDRAADGSMTLLEHLRELRGRLFKAALGIAVGFGIGMVLKDQALDLIKEPYCALNPDHACTFTQLAPTDYFVLQLKIALCIGLLIGAPVWLYQLWAFIAPGLHRHERRWAYWFAAVAAPLFLAGAFLAYFVVAQGPGVPAAELRRGHPDQPGDHPVRQLRHSG